jgi:hypothetical protein
LRVPVHKHWQLYRQSSNYEGRGHKRRHPLANRGPIFGRGHRSVRWVPLHCSMIVTPSAQCVIGIFLPPAWCARLSTRCRPARVSAERIYRRPGLTSQPIKRLFGETLAVELNNGLDGRQLGRFQAARGSDRHDTALESDNNSRKRRSKFVGGAPKIGRQTMRPAVPDVITHPAALFGFDLATQTFRWPRTSATSFGEIAASRVGDELDRWTLDTCQRQLHQRFAR